MLLAMLGTVEVEEEATTAVGTMVESTGQWDTVARLRCGSRILGLEER